MAITLTIANNGDGTGATATVAGSDATTNTVYYQIPGDGNWLSGGTRTGDGTVTIALPEGYYFAYCAGEVSGNAAVSNIVGLFGVTADTEAIHYKLMSAVESHIKAITEQLPNIDTTQVKKALAIVPTQLMLPAIVLTPAGRETKLGGTNARSDWGKPVVVSVIGRTDMDYSEELATWLWWRERVIRYFDRRRLAEVDEQYTTIVEPDLVVDWQSKPGAYQFLVSSFGLRFSTRELRAN